MIALYLCPQCQNLIQSAYCPTCDHIIPEIQEVIRKTKIATDAIPLSLILKGENPLDFKPVKKTSPGTIDENSFLKKIIAISNRYSA